MKTRILLNITIILVWIGLLFASQATGAQSLGFQIVFQPLQAFYNTNASNSFPGFEILTFILLTLIVLNYNSQLIFYYPGKLLWTFLIITTIFVCLSLINPKNSFENGFSNFITMRVTRTIIFYPLGLFVLLTLNNSSFIDFIKRFSKIGITIGVVRAMLDIVGFVTKTGVINHYGRHITTFGGEIQIWFSIFSVILFSIFLYLRKSKYLYISFLFLICLLFSYQRTAFFVTIAFYICFYSIYLFLFSKNFLTTILTTIVITLVVLYTSNLLLKTKIGKDLYMRYSSALIFTGYVNKEDYEGPEYSDSGHYKQSTDVTSFLVNNLNEFWGGGLKRRNEDYLNIEGQSKGGVHNNLASMWQYFGIPGLAYLVFIFLFITNYFVSIIKLRKSINFNSFILLAISNYFIIRIIAGWFSGDFFYMYYQLCFQYIILISTYKIYNQPNILNSNLIKTKSYYATSFK